MTTRPMEHLRVLCGRIGPVSGPRTDDEARRERLVLEATCPSCGDVAVLQVDPAGAVAWRRGELIQRALPTLTDDERERLMTGLCDPCFLEITKEPS